MSELDRRIAKVRAQQAATDTRKQVTRASSAEYERARQARFATLRTVAVETAQRLRGVPSDMRLRYYDHNATIPFWKSKSFHTFPEIENGWHVYNHPYSGPHNRSCLLVGNGALYFYNAAPLNLSKEDKARIKRTKMDLAVTEDKVQPWEGEGSPFPIDWTNQPFLPDFTSRAPWDETEVARVNLVMNKLAELVVAKHR